MHKMSKEDPILNAADEAAYAARKAREFAELFERYSKLLPQPDGQASTEQKYFDAMSALQLLKEAVESSNDWVVKSKGMQPLVGCAGEAAESNTRAKGATN